MNENDLKPGDFDQMDAAAQKVFEGLAKKVQARIPALNAIFGQAKTERFPLYSYVTFEDKARPEIDPVVVGVDVRVDTGEILIQAHIMGEESGAGHYTAPKKQLPFDSDHSVVLGEVTNAAQQLADNTAAVLDRVFGG
jgi:hypothetical protein